MKKILVIILAAAVLILAIIAIAGFYRFNFTNGGDVIESTNTQDVKNSSYIIDGQNFVLMDGTVTKEVAPGSASKQTVSIFGVPVYGDLNGDGANDAAIMLTSTGVGSGTFYYAVLAIASGTSYRTTNTLFLGDRIAPQTVEIREGRAVYNYAVRKANEPMTTQASVGKSLYVQYDSKSGEIGEFVNNFEGEADTTKMTLAMKKWSWVKTQMNDGKVTTPKKIDAFSLTFAKDNIVKVTTDCNGMSGSYTVSGDKIAFSQMVSTMMYCEGSQEQEFGSKLQDVISYMFTSKGELILQIKTDSGIMVFK